MGKIVRVRPSDLGGTCAVLHPETGQHVVPSPALTYDSDDPLVVAYPWLFASDDQLAALRAAGAGDTPSSVRVEDASARPGARRGSVRR